MTKISLKTIQNGMSRKEMKSIMAGSGSGSGCNADTSCTSGCSEYRTASTKVCNYCCLA